MQTIIGAFDTAATAQAAVDKLVNAGFDRSDVHVERGEATDSTQELRSAQTTGKEEPGMIRSFFEGLFGDKEEPQWRSQYDEAVRRGGSVVVVDAEDDTQAERAAEILDSLGAFDVKERAQQWQASGWRGDTGAAATPHPGGDKSGVLNVVQEELQVGKRTLDRGGVRVIQRVTQQPVREIVRLREEHALVERRPMDRPATEADLAGFGEGSIEIRETREEPVVSKQARVVEEVRVGKEVREREETIEDQVRRSDVDIERLPSQERERATAQSIKDRAEMTERERDALASSKGEAKKVVRKNSPKS